MGMGSGVTLSCCAASAGAFAIGLAVGGKHARGRRKRLRSRNESHNNHERRMSSVDTTLGQDEESTATLGENPGRIGREVTKFFDCPICLNELILPRLVPCGHTLCSRCLVALYNHERRPGCPVCRKRIKVGVDKLPVNFTVKSCVEARVAERGDEAWDEYLVLEQCAKDEMEPCGGDSRNRTRQVGMNQLQPAWNWFKWSIIIMTELGAFMASLKEILEPAPSRRVFQRSR